MIVELYVALVLKNDIYALNDIEAFKDDAGIGTANDKLAIT